MTQEQPIPVFDWFSNQFTVEGRAESLTHLGPHLVSLIQSGDRVLDLCCGAGGVSFFLEEQGAQVTGIDLAPGLIALAREEATRRRSQASFSQGNALTHDLGSDAYDLVVCLGNPIENFPHKQFSRFRDKVHRALKPAGRLAIEYRDGVLRFLAMSDPEEVVEEGATGQIVRRFKEYDPELGAFMAELRHLASGETYEATAYLYTGPMIHLMMEDAFELERSIRLSKSGFLDVYLKR
jgi:SAM-dependent methyltransferase